MKTNEDELKTEDILKNCPPTTILHTHTHTPLLLLRYYVTATAQLILNWKCSQVFKPEMEFHMINIIYAALPMRAQKEKTIFSCKDNCTFMKHTRSLTCYSRPTLVMVIWEAMLPRIHIA